jgi:hypothetical protein
MKFMITWRCKVGYYRTAIQQFLKTGAPPPKGVKTLGRWHVPGTQMGRHLVETNDMTALAESVAEWADWIEIDVHAVIEDAAAAEAVKRIYGK